MKDLETFLQNPFADESLELQDILWFTAATLEQFNREDDGGAL